MGLFDKIKNFFKKNNGIEEKKDIDISNIEKNINEKKSENDLLLSQKSEKLYNEIQIILNKLESDAKIVENIDLSEKKVEERLKSVNEVGRKDYLIELRRLIENLKLKKEGISQINHLSSTLHNFHKQSDKNYYNATLIIGNEMKKIKDNIIKIENLEREYIKENKILIENNKKIEGLILNEVERKVKIKYKLSLEKEIKLVISNEEENISKLNNLNIKIETEKNSDRFQKKENLNKELLIQENSLKSLESNINILLDKKILEKYVYLIENKDKIKFVNLYINNSSEAIINDESLEIFSIINEIKNKIKSGELTYKDSDKAIDKLNIEKEKLIGYRTELIESKNKIKELKEKIKGIKINLNQLISEKEKIELLIKDLTDKQLALSKRLEKTNIEIADIENEIIPILSTI